MIVFNKCKIIEKYNKYKNQTAYEVAVHGSLYFQSKKTAEKTLKLMDKVGSSLLGTKTVGEKPSVFKTKSLAMMLDRQVPSKIGGKKLGDGEGDGGVALPSASTLFGDNAGSLPSVDSQVGAERKVKV